MSCKANNPHDLDDQTCCPESFEAISQPEQSIVLGVFVKEPVPGKVKTRLGAQIGNEQAAQLYELFVQDLLCRFQELPQKLIMGYAPNTVSAKNWGQRLFGDDKEDRDQAELWAQPEGELGQRIASFFEHAFSASGVDSVVLIGSDSPTIPREYVLQAFEWLYQKDCVIGPSSDGGYYLIGLRKPCTELFQGVDWSQSSVLTQTLEKIKQAGLSLKLLPVWYDIDSKDDLQMLQGHLSALELAGEEDLPLQTHRWVSQWNSVSS